MSIGRHNHEQGAPLTVDCDNWCKLKIEQRQKQQSGAPMTPDRIQEIRTMLAQGQRMFWAKDIMDLLAALATAEAEGRRQGVEEGKGSAILAALLLVEGEYLEEPQPNTGDEAYQQAVTDCAQAVRQLLIETPC